MAKQWLLKVVVCTLSIIVMVRLEVDSDAESRVFLRAQCKAMCLDYFEQPKEAAITKMQNRLGIERDLAVDCFQNHQDKCRNASFSACDNPPSRCQTTCSMGQVESMGCRLGCLLLADIHNNRSGECPRLNVATSEEEEGSLFRLHPPICHKECTSDASCPHPLHKCCTIGCSRNCTMPNFSEAVPPLPPRLSLQPVQERPGTMRVSWSSTYANFSLLHGPLVFILQIRFCTRKHFTEEQAYPWQTILMAVETEATLDTFSPDQKYQFRLAAVSTQGSRGFGPASRSYSPSLLRPQPPRNVTVTKWRIHPNGEVSVRLRWTPPEPTDLRLINYSISWALDSGSPITTSSKPLKASNVPFVQSARTEDSEITISPLRPGSSYKVQVTAIYFHEEGNLESLPHNFFISPQSPLPVHRQQNMAFESAQYVPAASLGGHNDDDRHDGGGSRDGSHNDCKCSGLTKNDERLEIRPPEVFNGDLTAIAQFKSFSHMDSQSYRIEWFPQVCIDSAENSPFLKLTAIPSSAAGPTHPMDTDDRILVATVRSRIFRLTKLKFNCVYMVRLTPEGAADPRSHSESPPRRQHHRVGETPPLLPSLSPSSGATAVDVVAGCFCTRTCRETKTAWGTKPIDCPAAEPEPPKPPRDVKVELVNYERLDYQVSWHPPLSSNAAPSALPIGASHPAGVAPLGAPLTEPPADFTRYRVLWAPRMEEPVEASMYNDEAGFSPIPDLQQSDVRVLDKNQTSLILPRLRPRTFYILRIQTISSTTYGRERESAPAVSYFNTLDDGFHNTRHGDGPFMELPPPPDSSGRLTPSLWPIVCAIILRCFLMLLLVVPPT